MARSREYFIERLKRDNFNTLGIKGSNDIDEIQEVMIYNHIKEGHQLSKDDIGTLREVLRMFIADNEDQKKQDNRIIITTATQAIEAIDPKLVSVNKETVNFSATIGEKFLTPENIGAKAPGFIAEGLCKMYEKQRIEEGNPIPENEKFNREEWEKSGVGSAFSSLGALIAKHAAERIKREKLFGIK